MITMVTIQESKTEKGYSRFSVTIPRSLVKALGWKKGDKLDISVNESEIRPFALVLTKVGDDNLAENTNH
jgi:bifunctional DNA-binding transcriptional regulator/antitoxin component of YhaV-PrlF toxin-antitoxin module